MRRALHRCVLVMTLLAGVACSGGPDGEAGPSGVRVVASTSLYASLVRAVGGDAVTVTAAVSDAAADPHELVLSAATAASIRRADLVVVNGGGYDEAVATAAASLAAERLIDAVAVSGLRDADRAGTDGVEFNEHVWYSVPAVRRIVGRLASSLSSLAPEHAAAIAGSAADLDRRLGALEERIAAARPKIQAAAAKAAVTEPVADRLLGDLGFAVATPAAFTEAVEEGADPAATDLKAQLDLLRSRSVRVLVHNEQTTSPVTDQVVAAATTNDVPIVGAHEQLPDGTIDLVALLEAQVALLVTASGAG